MSIRLISFDLDDTLYKERDFVASGYRAIARSLADLYGFNYAEMLHVMTTAPLNPFDSLEEYIVNRSIQRSIVVKEGIDWMVNTYRYHHPDITISDDVRDTLVYLKEHGNRLALITDGRVITQANKISSLGLDEFMDHRNISISEAVGSEKYHETPFLRIMRLNPDIKDFVYVGDNPMKDFLWPNRLGWKTIQLRDNGRNVHSQSIAVPDRDYQPQIVIDSIPELKSMF